MFSQYVQKESLSWVDRKLTDSERRRDFAPANYFFQYILYMKKYRQCLLKVQTTHVRTFFLSLLLYFL